MDQNFSVYLNNVPCFDISQSCNIININNVSVNSIYKPLDFSKISYYYPTIDTFSNKSFTNTQYTSLATDRQIINHNTVIKNDVYENDVNIFFKFAPLLDTTRYMIGKYKDFHSIIQNLPSNKDDKNIIDKYKSRFNASYTDNFASFLISKLLLHHNFVNGIEYFGSFLAIQKNM